MWTLNFHPVFARHASIYPGDQAALASESLRWIGVGAFRCWIVPRIRFLFFPSPPDSRHGALGSAEKFRLESSGQARVIPLFSPCCAVMQRRQSGTGAREGRARGVMPCRFCEAAASKRKKQCVKRRERGREEGKARITSARARAFSNASGVWRA